MYPLFANRSHNLEKVKSQLVTVLAREEGPFIHLQLDFILLPSDHGYKYVLVLVVNFPDALKGYIGFSVPLIAPWFGNDKFS